MQRESMSINDYHMKVKKIADALASIVQELHNVQRESMSINDYHMKVKKIANALASIGSLVEDDDLVSVNLNGLGKDYAQFWISISVCEKFLDFEELIAF